MINIKPEERRNVGWLLVHSFCNGVATSSLISAAPSLFLEHFKSSSLPFCYIGTAILLPLIGIGTMRFASKVSLRKLLYGNLIFLAVAAVAFRTLFSVEMQRVAAAMLVTWVDVQVFLLAFEFETLTGTLFDIRRAKTIFPIVGAGELIAGILGGLSIPLFTKEFGAHNLLWISASALLGGMAAVGMIKWESAKHPTHEEVEPKANQTSARISPLAFTLMATAALADIASLIGDNIFYSHLEQRHPTADEMAGFLGYYLACAGTVALVMRLVITPYLYRRFGITTGMIVGPLVTSGFACLLVAWTTGMAQFYWMPFWGAVALKLNDDVHRKSNHRTGVFLMLQALPIAERLRTSALMDGVFGAMIGGGTGAVLILIHRIIPAAIPWLLCGIATGWVIWTLRIKQTYVEALSAGIRQRLVLPREERVLDFGSQNLIRTYLKGDDPALILYAMHCLGEQGVTITDASELINHSIPEIRCEAARLLAVIGNESCFPMLESRAKIETDLSTLCIVIDACVSLSRTHGLITAKKFFDSPHDEVRTAAVAAVFKRGLAAADTIEIVQDWVNSPSPALRTTVATIASASKSALLLPMVRRLLHDNDLKVKLAAIEAAGKIWDQEVTLVLIGFLNDQRIQNETVVALLAHGPGVIELLRDRLLNNQLSTSAKHGIFRVIGQIDSTEAINLLWERLHARSRSERILILENIIRYQKPTTDQQRELLCEILEQEAADAATTRRILCRFSPVTDLDFALIKSIDSDHKASLSRLLYALCVVYKSNLLEIAIPHLLDGVGTKLAYAMETVDNVLSAEHRNLLTPCLAGLSDLTASMDASREAIINALTDFKELHGCCLSALTRMLAIRWLSASESILPPRLNDCYELWVEEALQSDEFHAICSREGLNEVITRMVAVSNTPFFESIPASPLVQLVQHMRLSMFAPDTLIMTQDAPGNSLFVIISGEILVHKSGTNLAQLGPGSVVGEMSVLSPEPRMASVTAITTVQAFELDRELLLSMMREHCELTVAIIKMLSSRLRYECN